MRIHKGDLVKVVAGEDSGKSGKIKRVLLKKNRIIVEGINLVHKHLKPSQENQKGGRIQKEAPIAISNVQPVCLNKNCVKYNAGVRVKMKILNDNNKVRSCAKCGYEITVNV